MLASLQPIYWDLPMILQSNLRDGNKVQKHHMVQVRSLIFKWPFFTETIKVLSGKNPKPVWNSVKFSKSRLYGNQTFSFPDTGLSKIEKKSNKEEFQDFSIFFFLIYFWHQICVLGPYLMRIDISYLIVKMFKI